MENMKLNKGFQYLKKILLLKVGDKVVLYPGSLISNGVKIKE